MIADTRYCDYPAEAANLPKVGGMTDVDIEKIVKLKPDLILASYSGNNRETVENLQMLGFHVVTLYEKNVTDILTNIRIVGELFGKKHDVVCRRMRIEDKQPTSATETHEGNGRTFNSSRIFSVVASIVYRRCYLSVGAGKCGKFLHGISAD